MKVESPEEIIDRDAKVRDERIRSEAGLDVLWSGGSENEGDEKVSTLR